MAQLPLVLDFFHVITADEYTQFTIYYNYALLLSYSQYTGTSVAYIFLSCIIIWFGSILSCSQYISTVMFLVLQMVCGVWSQTDLEEEGASCEAVAWHAFSRCRWIQARRWAWGQWWWRTWTTMRLCKVPRILFERTGSPQLPQDTQGRFYPPRGSRV